ncbi:hypothetical protein SLS62_002471 [Diatrype stigma]|uniref:ER transporter 6TM N-terminal domain-containing protein n=1 Tax=Diatrype stigma TaxID=117547 RepID=A0AAN9YUY3_9PEZI
MSLKRELRERLLAVVANLQRNHLWQRMLKNIVCTTTNLIIGIIPAVIAVYGRSTYLAPMVSVFGHPGRRFGQVTEALILILLGTFIGIAWATLGLFLSSLVVDSNIEAAYAIRAVFFALAVILHGVLRSSTPRLFLFVFFMLLISLTVLTGTATSVSASMVTQILYPILTATPIILGVNVLIFPEFSSSFLGNTTIETLCQTVNCFRDAGDWFLTSSDGTTPDKDEAAISTELRTKLVSLTDRKTKLRSQLSSCQSAQAECNFEIVFAALPPRSLKRISTNAMARFVHTTIAIINACESKYALIGDNEEDPDAEVAEKSNEHDSDSSTSSSSDSSDDEESGDSKKHRRRKSRHQRNVELVKPIREIESGDSELLEHILRQVQAPAKALQDQMFRAVQVISAALAQCYDVPKLPPGFPRPEGIILEEIDVRMAIFMDALALFDRDSAQALENAAAVVEGRGGMHGDIMPRMETHLIASFLTNARQAAAEILDMLRHSRSLVEKREAKSGRRRFYFPQISWKKWLTTGGENDGSALPEDARKEARTGRGLQEDRKKHDDDSDVDGSTELLRNCKDEENGLTNMEKTASSQRGAKCEKLESGEIPRRKGPKKSDVSTVLWLRGLAADAVEFVADSDDLAFALKMSIAAWLLTWPAFVPGWNAWYGSIRGSWASLQLIIVFEVSVGTSFEGFFLRVFGVIFGCVVGFLAYVIGDGNRVVTVVVLAIGLVPSFYVQLGTSFVKTGIISAVSMSVVGLATVLQQDTNHPWQIFVMRMVCFLIGGTVALLVELCLFPVRARDRMVESLASSIQQISQMEASVAVAIDAPVRVDIKSHALNENFRRAKGKAEQALAAARTFLRSCFTEPRLKGSFKGQSIVYGEMIYVLFQIIERMDNVLYLREAYGSSILEELNAEVLPYRRNVAASITITLFAVHEALTTRLPLPQFLPSSRVAQLRYISRVRELLLEKANPGFGSGSGSGTASGKSTPPPPLSSYFLKSMTKQSFLSWNAASAGAMEIIEYLEELVDLAKLLVGVNAFRSGMLERPHFHEYMRKIKEREALLSKIPSMATTDGAGDGAAEQQTTVEKPKRRLSVPFRRRGASMAAGKQHQHTPPGVGIMRRRSSAGLGGGDATADADRSESAIEDDLPMSLQRVRTKRLEERGQERLRRTSTADHKGKGVLRPSKTWAI